jgi:hypothetical protein
VSSTTVPGVTVQLEIERATGLTRLRLRIVNGSTSPVDVSLAAADTRLVVGRNSYRVSSSRSSLPASEAASLRPGGVIEHVMAFRIPDSVDGPCAVILRPGNAGAAAFPRVSLRLPPR